MIQNTVIDKIDKSSSIPRYYQFMELIQKQIESGVLKEGDRLQAEPELIKRYEISSATVRRAFSELSKEGLITRKNGKGTFVNFSNLSKPSNKILNKKLIFLNYMEPDKAEYGYESSTFVMQDIQRGMMKESYKRKIQLEIFNVFIMNGKRIPTELGEIVKDCDGIIFPHYDEYLFDRKIVKDKPYIVVNHPENNDSINMIYTNYEDVGFLAAEHLINIGHKNIGLIRSGKGSNWYDLREKGFRKAMKKYSIPVNENLIIKCEGNRKSDGFTAGELLLSKAERPSAVYVDTDWKALGVCEAVIKQGLKIPKNIAVIGTDNIGPAQMSNPSLSTVGIPREKQGAKAIELLDKIIKGEFKKLIQYEIKPELIIRKSTVNFKE
ncbi:MAG: hypothetical protein A2044_05350 [Candidatus Firestonebacteria bacterium GWA2_43_8]|nr:MAG: hypothetical protein A2044_05350 [Candidatus Firestonebacteria bacterium GWA2_43_8]